MLIPCVYTVKIVDFAQRSSQTQEFDELSDALKWMRKKSKSKTAMASIERSLTDEDEEIKQETFIYQARYDDTKFGTFQSRNFEDLASAKHWLKTHYRHHLRKTDIPSITPKKIKSKN